MIDCRERREDDALSRPVVELERVTRFAENAIQRSRASSKRSFAKFRACSWCSWSMPCEASLQYAKSADILD